MSDKATMAGNRYEYRELHHRHGKPSGWQKIRQQGFECLYRRPIAQASEPTPAEAHRQSLQGQVFELRKRLDKLEAGEVAK